VISAGSTAGGGGDVGGRDCDDGGGSGDERGPRGGGCGASTSTAMTAARRQIKPAPPQHALLDPEQSLVSLLEAWEGVQRRWETSAAEVSAAVTAAGDALRRLAVWHHEPAPPGWEQSAAPKTFFDTLCR
jgi:hypothetical protein